MSDVIQLLPDSVANQIAAGEVIQRPASVVKELVENAVDAGSTQIKIIIKDAGRTLIQIIDNGCGLSETDARMAFERHATSKIRRAEDLFTIYTLGFRGEALASIAAVAEIELKTRRPDDELGIALHIRASEVISQEPVNTPQGSSFSIKNLFFNIPARRKFLKTDATELKHILNEFKRIALVYPQIGFELYHNNSQVFDLKPANLRQRIVAIMGKQFLQALIPVETQTAIIKIQGFIAKPEFARKTKYEQYFFINQRFMRKPYFHKALMLAYEELLPHNVQPSYFLYLEADPASIDVNIHPTKTEIKFEEAPAIFQIIRAVCKQALGKFNAVPSIDFDTRDKVEMPHKSDATHIKPPEIHYDSSFNPFENRAKHQNKPPKDWEKLYAQPQDPTDESQTRQNFESAMNRPETAPPDSRAFLQLKNKYIATAVKSGIMVVHQKRAQERISFEKILDSIKNTKAATQQSLYPAPLALSAADMETYREIEKEIAQIGFDIEISGNQKLIILGTPDFLQCEDPADFLENLLAQYQSTGSVPHQEIVENIAKAMASAETKQKNTALSQDQMRQTIDQLFACALPNYSPEGKKIVYIWKMQDLEHNF